MEDKVKRPSSTEKTDKEKKEKIEVIKKFNDDTDSLPKNRTFPSSSSSEIENKQSKYTVSNESHHEAYLISKYKRILRFVAPEEFKLDLRKLVENGNSTSSVILLDRAQCETLASSLPQLQEKLEDVIRGRSTNFREIIEATRRQK